MWLTGSYDPRARSALLDGRQSRTADRSLRPRRARQSVQRFGRGHRCEDRAAEVALPVHAQRRPRLGLVPGRGPRRSRVARPDAQAPAARRSQRPLLRARPRDREFLSGTPFVLRELDRRASTRRAGPVRSPGSNSSAAGSFFVYPDARRRHQLPGAVLQPAHRLVLPGILRKRPALRQRAGAIRSRASSTSAGRPSGTAVGPKPGEPRRSPPASRPSIRTPARRCGTSRSRAGRWRTASWPRPAISCSPRSPTATLAALDARTGEHRWHFQTNAAHGGVAHELRRRRPAVRGHRRRQRGLRVRAPRVVASGIVAQRPLRRRDLRPARRRCSRIAGARSRLATSAAGEVLELRDPRTPTTVSIVPASATSRSR